MHGCGFNLIGTASGSGRPGSKRRVIGVACAVLLASGMAHGQVRLPGLEDDGNAVPSNGPDRALPTPPVQAQPDLVRPNAPVAPISDLDTGGFIGGGLLSEGTFLAGAKGRPVRGRSGAWYIIFDQDQRGPAGQAIPAMVLMPNLHLAAIERLSSRLQEGQRVAISGQVFVYAGVNHLFATTPPIVEMTGVAGAPSAAPNASPADKPAAQEKPGSEKPAPASAAPENQPGSVEPAKPEGGAPSDVPTAAAPSAPKVANGEPTVEQIIEQLDKAVGSSKRVDLPRITGAEAGTDVEGSGAAPALVPGGYLASRSGRVVRGNDGSPTFVFDSGASGQREGPMVLLPCLNLMRLENIAAVQGEKAKLTVSGDVVVYRNKNYLLPRMFTVNRRTDVVMSGQ